MNTILDHSINEHVKERAARYAEAFSQAKPFRHVAIDNFFSDDVLEALVSSFPPFDEQLAINENGVVGGKAVHEKVTELGPAWVKLDELVKGKAFRDLVSHITGIPDLQYDPHYFGGGTHENRQGQGLDAHVDFNFHPITRQHRRLNMIVYLTEEWQDEWGGSIQLHRDPYLPPSEDDIVVITPKLNRCVMFETNEYSWHGFPRIELPEDKQHLSRKSFALYYYTDTRPVEDTGPEHSTIYVEQHLPEDFHAGMVLESDQLQHVRNLIASRDQHLKRLYEDIKRLNTELGQARDQLAVEREQHSLLSTDDASADGPGEMNPDLRRQQTEILRLRQRIEELENSTSWRITAPIRGVKRALTGRK